MLNRTIITKNTSPEIIGCMLFEIGDRHHSLKRTQSEAWGGFSAQRLEAELVQLISDRDYLLSLLS